MSHTWKEKIKLNSSQESEVKETNLYLLKNFEKKDHPRPLNESIEIQLTFRNLSEAEFLE